MFGTVLLLLPLASPLTSIHAVPTTLPVMNRSSMDETLGLIAAAGGMLPGHRFKAYQPGGPSSGLLPAALDDIPLDFDTPVKSLRDGGVKVTKIDLDGRSHFNLLVPGTADFARIGPDLLRVARGE